MKVVMFTLKSLACICLVGLTKIVFAANLLDTAGGAEITAIDRQLNATSWAAANLIDNNNGTRWLSNKQANDINFIFNSAKDTACFDQFELVNYGNDDRSVSRFLLFRTQDGDLSNDIGTTGWTPIAADLNPSGPINFTNWGQGGRLTLINKQLNSTSWAAKNSHDGDTSSRWLSNTANNQLEFAFDTNWDGNANDTVNVKQIKIYNYGTDDRSVKLFQIETSSDGINWQKLEVPGSSAGEADFNFALLWHGANLDAIDRQLNSTSWAAKNIQDGDNNSRWLSNKGNNTLDFSFDVDKDGTSGLNGDADDEFTIEKIYLRNYGVDDRSINEFQIEVKVSGSNTWQKIKAPGAVVGTPDYNFLLDNQGGTLDSFDSQLNGTSWAAKNSHDGDNNTRWLSNKGNNTLDFSFDTDLDGQTGAAGDTDDLFTMDKFYLRNYGVDDRSIRQFQIEVKTDSNNTWQKLFVPGSAANQAGYHFNLAVNGGQLDLIDSQLNSSSWAAKNIHDGDRNTRWLSNKQNNTLEFSFDTDWDGGSGDSINLDTVSLINYGVDDRSVNTFEIDIKINNGTWQAVTAPGGGTVFNANMDGNGQNWAVGPFTNVTAARIRTLSNHGDPSYTGARELIFSGLSVGPSTLFNAAMHGNGETFSVNAVDVTHVRVRTVNNHGDPSYTGAREFKVLGDSLGVNYTFSAAMNGNGETFTLDPGDRPSNVTAVRLRTINNHGDPSYTGAREFGVLGTSIGANNTFSLPMTTGPHTITLDNDDIVSDVKAVRFISIQNHGDPSYTGLRELEILGDPVGPDYIFTAQMNNATQLFDFTPSMGKVFRFHSLSNHGDPSYTGAAEFKLRASNHCIMAEWRMDEPFWDGSTNQIEDSSGNGYHGTSHYGIDTMDASDPLVNGGLCRVGHFDDNGYIELPSFPNLTESYTVTGWFNTTDSTESGQRIFADDELATGGYGVSVGDPANRINFFHRSFSPENLTNSTTINSNQWYFFAAVINPLINTADKTLYIYDATGNLLDSQTVNVNGTIQASTGLASIGGEVDGAEAQHRFKGFLDEIKVFRGHLTSGDIQNIVSNEANNKNWDGSDNICASGNVLDHIEIQHDGEGLTCLPETITIKACQNADCSTLYTDDVTITLLPADANSSWIGSTTISNGSGTLDLSHTIAEDVTLGVSSATPAAANNPVCNNGGTNDCVMTFADAGLVFTMNNQNACQTTSLIELQAVKKADAAVTCEPAFSGNRQISFTTSYILPANGNKKFAITPQGGSEEVNPDSNPVTIDFDNNNNSFQARYDDVGRVTLTADYSDGSGLQLSGSQTFVVLPDQLNVLAKLPSAQGGTTLNATTPGASPFRKAGSDIFEVEVIAECEDDLGTIKQTRNFQSEVVLSAESPQPSPGNLGALGGNISRDDFSQVANVYDKLLFDDISYSEVGYFTLRAIATNYLGTGNTYQGTHVTGRFIPDHFRLVTPFSVATAADWAASFVYMDQAKLKIEYLLEAQNSSNIVTQNYNGNFAVATVTSVAENNDNGTDLSSRLSSISGAWLNGQMIFSMDNIVFSRDAATDGPFSNLEIGLQVDDQEIGASVDLQSLDMNATLAGACDPLLTCNAKLLGTTDVRYGRISVANSYGIAELPLSNINIKTEYFNSSLNRFVLNTEDSFTSFDVSSDIDWSVASYSGVANGDIESSGAGNLSNGQGVYSIHKASDNSAGPGVTGYVDYNFVAPNWLKFNWSGTGDVNPKARASFGIYKRSKRLIYSREVY